MARSPQVLTRAHHGLHEAEGLWWLLEAEGNYNARNLPIKCPLAVSGYRGHVVGHSLGTLLAGAAESLDFTAKLSRDAVLKTFLPTPQQGRYFVPQTPERLRKLLQLQQLSNVTRPLAQAAELLTPAQARTMALGSNITPVIIHNASVRWVSRNEDILDIFLTSYRSLILTGSEDIVLPPWIVRHDPKKLDRLKIPENLPQIGASYLKDWMRSR